MKELPHLDTTKEKKSVRFFGQREEEVKKDECSKLELLTSRSKISLQLNNYIE